MAEPTRDDRIEQLEKELKELKARASLETERQTQDTLAMKAMVDALKDQAVSQYALASSQAQAPFAELQGIKEGLAGLSLPEGKEGTVKVSAGTPGAGLLRSKRPMLQLLDDVAAELIPYCQGGAVLMTKDRLAQADSAMLTLKRIDDQRKRLTDVLVIAQADLDRMAEEEGEEASELEGGRGLDEAGPRALTPAFPAGIAGAYALGTALDTVNNLAKILRADRRLDVFGADSEAENLLVHLLEARSLQSKDNPFIANPGATGEKAMTIAESLLESLGEFGEAARRAGVLLERIKGLSDSIARDHPDDPAWQARRPPEANVVLLKAVIDDAASLLDGLNPTKKLDEFAALLSGKAIAEGARDKLHLFLDVKAQTIQVTESRRFSGDRILATGEVQVAYRILDSDGTPIRSGVILKASKSEDSRFDRLEILKWPQ
ncbi:hypothetical protein [Tautonia plasticadhaerens]|uniref:Uncharacterized protein n=1 Tax=Tautonia plasticadhaerens TaxID=2527974 RepID=A0A518H981_9BACT|nr:hypothetical protein [Tautonia plasticadhaerens]QDV37402.1 hypothetical protein ElP_53410 [Tautonia plasticadhaerens]